MTFVKCFIKIILVYSITFSNPEPLVWVVKKLIKDESVCPAPHPICSGGE